MKTDGSPEAGVISMAFSVYGAATGGTALGCDAAQVAFSDGYYAVILGDLGGCTGGGPAIVPSLFNGQDLWLEVAVGGSALSPRQRLGSVAYAHRATTAVHLRGGTVEATAVTVGGPNGLSVTPTGIALAGAPVVDSSGKASVAVGTGLTGNGSTASPLAVTYGAAAGTAAQGNDPRLSDARAPTTGSAAYVQNQTAAPQNASFSIGGAGSVGGDLGVGTGGGESRLQVQGAAAIAGSGTLTSSGTAVTGSGTSFNTQLRVGDVLIVGGQSAMVTAIASATSLTTQTAFNPALTAAVFSYQKPVIRILGSSGAGQMVVSSTGSVGVGTVTPAARLDVAGDLRAESAVRGAQLNTLYGNVFASGSLAAGQSGGFANPNAWSGNGKVSITVCSMHSANPIGGHVYKVYLNAHGQGYNDYGPSLLERLTDQGLSLGPGSACVFTNSSAASAQWIIKQLPITVLAGTMNGY